MQGDPPMKAGTPWDQTQPQAPGNDERRAGAEKRSSCSLYSLRCRVKPKSLYLPKKNTQRDYYPHQVFTAAISFLCGKKKKPQLGSAEVRAEKGSFCGLVKEDVGNTTIQQYSETLWYP
jgi:hypothetical protein